MTLPATSVVGVVIREGLAFPVIGLVVGAAASAGATRADPMEALRAD